MGGRVILSYKDKLNITPDRYRCLIGDCPGVHEIIDGPHKGKLTVRGAIAAEWYAGKEAEVFFDPDMMLEALLLYKERQREGVSIGRIGAGEA